jgi:hypothetical protein
MADISNLEGINSSETDKLCRANIKTVEGFLSQIADYGFTFVSINTGIKPDRLIELMPPDHVQISLLPDTLLESLAARVLREAPPDDPWLRRCGFGLHRFARGFRGNWEGWQENLPLFALVAGLLLLVALTLRGAGRLQWLPAPLGLHDSALVTANPMESGVVLKAGDLYPVLLPAENDYFKPDVNLEGLILAQSKSGQTPLRFRDVLRQQVIAVKDIQANVIIQKEDITLAWTTYQPCVALKLEEVYGREARYAIRKDGVILSQFIKPAPPAPAGLPYP